MTSKEFLDHIKSEEELISRGYKREKCKTCDGRGHGYPIFGGCKNCSEQGYTWILSPEN